jgi:hypothetical protein
MSDVPNKPEQVDDTNTNNCENDYGQASGLYFLGLFLISSIGCMRRRYIVES